MKHNYLNHIIQFIRKFSFLIGSLLAYLICNNNYYWSATKWTCLITGVQFELCHSCINRPFPSCLLPLFQNESWCTTFHMEISLICKTMNVQVKLISITKVVHQEIEAKGNSENNDLLCALYKWVIFWHYPTVCKTDCKTD